MQSTDRSFLLYLKSIVCTDEDLNVSRLLKYSIPLKFSASSHSIAFTAFASVIDTLPSILASKFR